MNQKYFLLTYLIALFCFDTNAMADVKLETVSVSHYIWRGFNVTNNKPAFQPSLTFKENKTGISVNIWNSTGFNRDQTRSADEWDITLSYSKVVSKIIEISGGYIHYNYPNVNIPNDSYEFNLGFALSTVLAPSVKVYYDANMGRGVYVAGSIAQKISTLPVVAGAVIGYNDGMFIQGSGMTDITLSLSGNFPLPNKNVYIISSLNYMICPGYMQGKNGLSHENVFWGTIGLGISY